MIVLQIDVDDTVIIKTKSNSPIRRNKDGVYSLALTFEFVKFIFRQIHVFWYGANVKSVKHAFNTRRTLNRNCAAIACSEKSHEPFVAH